MSDFVKQLTDSVAAQALELAELKKALAELTAPKPKPAPIKVDSRPDPIVRDHAHDAENYEADVARRRQIAQAHREQEASYMAKLQEGLPDGQWRDGGLIRDREGKVVLSGKALEQKLAREAGFDKAAREADLSWRRSVELPILHGAGDADDDGA